MLGLILWIMSMGFMLYSQTVVAVAAREAARHVAIHGEDNVNAVIGETLQLVVPRGETYSVEINQGDIVTVSITYDYAPFADFRDILSLFQKDYNSQTAIRGRAHYKNERPRGP